MSEELNTYLCGCGGSAVYLNDLIQKSSPDLYASAHWYECARCKLSTRFHKTKEDAATAWNTAMHRPDFASVESVLRADLEAARSEAASHREALATVGVRLRDELDAARAALREIMEWMERHDKCSDFTLDTHRALRAAKEASRG